MALMIIFPYEKQREEKKDMFMNIKRYFNYNYTDWLTARPTD